jgi:hypothetical protein
MTALPAYEKLGAFYLGRPVDPTTGGVQPLPLLYDSRDLLTHAVIIGMTGSGKTGLGICLLEEAVLDGVPALVIDPKGDLGNLLLAFPDLSGESLEPWIDGAEAARQGLSRSELAAREAERWRRGLADWDQDAQRVRRLRDACEAVVYTPGSDAGLPISILGSLAAPKPPVREDRELLSERVRTLATSLLGLVGIPADPLTSREHILLASLLADRWQAGRDFDLPALIQAIQSPPFERLGVLDLETFFPGRDRFAMAVALNNLLAAPGMAQWVVGEPLDVDRLLYGPAGKPRLAVVSIAHLSDAERMSFVALLLNETVAWMRSRSGSSSLAAILYMDEVFGYLPPVAEPPSKRPLLTLLKQARAYGLGVVLATQNPVDLDYKALANAGTWFLGRLQTEQDKERVLSGLAGVAAADGSGFDRPRMDGLLSGLAKRVFLLHNAGEPEPLLFHTRWALSYLRGPLTRAEIKLLMDSRRAAPAEVAAPRAAAPAGGPADGPAAPVSAAVAPSATRPLLPPDVPQVFLVPRGSSAELVYRPGLLGLATVHYRDDRRGVAQAEDLALLQDLACEGTPDWRRAAALDRERWDPERDSEPEPRPGASFAELPAAAAQAKSYRGWEKDLAEVLFRERRLELAACTALGETARPGEGERELRIRLADRTRELREAEKEKLRRRYASRLETQRERERRAEERLEREREQARDQKAHTLLRFGETAAAVLFGRRSFSRSAVSRASTALRGVSRSAKEGRDVDRAEEGLEAVQLSRRDLEAELARELAALAERFDPEALAIETVTLRPRRADVEVRSVALAWIPYRPAAGGREPAWR